MKMTSPPTAGPKGSRTWNYMKGLVTGYAATLATILVGLWLTPFTLRFLDYEEYGIFALAPAVVMWLAFLDLGMSASIAPLLLEVASPTFPRNKAL